MKTNNPLLGSAFALLVALGMISSPAYAYDPLSPATCNEGSSNGYKNVPPASGPLTISRTDLPPDPAFDTCTLGSYHTSGDIVLSDFTAVIVGDLTSDNGHIGIYNNVSSSSSVGNLTAGTDIWVGAHTVGAVTAGTSGGGSIDIYTDDGGTIGEINGHGGYVRVVSQGSVTAASIANTDGIVLVQAYGTANVPSITNKNGDVRIFANYEQSSGEPQIVGPGGIGYIHNNGDTGYGIYVSSPTGITYNGSDLLQTHADSGIPGYIYLDGGSSGNVTLSGSIVNSKSDGAGAIGIFAPEVITNGITLSASASAGQPVGSVGLFTNKVTNSGGLTINVNGDGASEGEIHSGITPVGSWSISVIPATYGYIQYGEYQNVAHPLDVTGSGTLSITANGDNQAIQIYGYPLNFSSGTINITQQGKGDALYLFSSDNADQYGQLTLGGTVQIHENTKGVGTRNVLDIRSTSLAALTGHVLLDSSGIDGGDGGDITLPFDSGSLALGGIGNNLEIKADGSSTGGKGGQVTVGFGGNLAVSLQSDTAVDASAKGGSGNGGQVTVQAFLVSSEAGAAAFISADGHGGGKSGTIAIEQTSNSALDLSGLTLNVNGAPPDSEVNVDVSYNGTDSVKIGTISAKNVGGSDGGNIRLSNKSNNDLIVDVIGKIDTSASGNLSGSVSLIVSDSFTNNVALNLESSAEFQSIVSTEANAVSVVALSNNNEITLGLGSISANNGDVTLCLDDSNGCVATAFSAKRPLLQQASGGVKNVECISGGSVRAEQGSLLSLASSLKLRNDCTVQVSNSATNSLLVNEIDFGANSFIENGSTTVISDGDLKIDLAAGSTAGFKNSRLLEFTTQGSGSISVTKTGTGATKFALGGADLVTTTFKSNGNISVDNNINLGEDDPDSAITPSALDIQSTVGAITLRGSVYAKSTLTVDNSAATQDVTLGGFVGAIAPHGVATISAGGNLIQPATNTPTISSTAVLTLQSTYGNIGAVSEQIHVGAKSLTVNAEEGSAYVYQSNGSLIIDASYAKINLAITVVEAIEILSNLTANDGYLVIRSVSGLVIIAPNSTIEGDSTVAIVSGTYTVVAGTPAANVTVAPGSGTINWGTSPGITSNGVGNTVQAVSPGAVVTFQGSGITDAIRLLGTVLIRAN